jgi:hypothetical protein
MLCRPIIRLSASVREDSSHIREVIMARKSVSDPFIQQIKRQLLALRESDPGYESLHVYVAGIPEPWKFADSADFEFHEDSKVLIVRARNANENGNESEAPEYVFRLDAIVATQLV